MDIHEEESEMSLVPALVLLLLVLCLYLLHVNFVELVVYAIERVTPSGLLP